MMYEVLVCLPWLLWKETPLQSPDSKCWKRLIDHKSPTYSVWGIEMRLYCTTNGKKFPNKTSPRICVNGNELSDMSRTPQNTNQLGYCRHKLLLKSSYHSSTFPSHAAMSGNSISHIDELTTEILWWHFLWFNCSTI